MKKTISALILGGGVMASMIGNAQSVEWSSETDRSAHAGAHLPVYGETTPPIGFVQFCRQNGSECRGGSGSGDRMAMTDDRWTELSRINTFVNGKIEPVTDQDLYNVPEYWTYPENKGDCEDYVLLKKYYLSELGWPSEALLITVVLDQNNEGHAVLTVSTSMGDFVLDNQSADILPWQDTPYRYIKRQSQLHPAVWVSLDPEYASSNTTTAARLTTDR